MKSFREIPPQFLYPGMVVGILMMSVLAHVVLLVKASSDGGPQIVPNYYEKAANWDKYQAEKAAEAAQADGSDLAAHTTRMASEHRWRPERTTSE